MFYTGMMNRVAPEAAEISAAILSAPGWARVAITMPDPRMRERGADELARAIATSLSSDPREDHRDQLPLGI
jgi:hypothetical protein